MPKRPYSPKHHIQKQMPTARFGGGYIVFRDDLFIADLQKVVGVTLNRIGKMLIKRAQSNLAAIQFHYFPVRLAGEAVPEVGIRRTKKGYGRTDASRKFAVIDSMVLGDIARRANNKLGITVYTLAKNFKDSHIGIYYEHGTGQYADGSYTRVSGMKYEENPLRSGMDIYTRPGQEWTDLGGNRRISNAGSLRKLPGFAVRPQRWFARAFEYANSQFARVFSEELQYMDIRKYLQVKSKIIIGGRRK